MGGKRRRTARPAGNRPPSQAALQRQAAAARRAQAEADKAREARRLAEIFAEILTLHRHEFVSVERPVAPMPPLPDANLIRDWHEKNALRGVSRFDRTGRARAREYATATAQAELNARARQAQGEQARAQLELDAQWARLVSNDPDTVLATLAEAFEDNEAAAAAIGVDRDQDEVTLAVLVPGEDAVPERMPDKTQAGNLTLRKLTKAERSSFYQLLVSGHVLVTLRETFAVAPGINFVRLVAVRPTAPDVYGRKHLECMLAGRWTRRAFHGVQWQDANAGKILGETAVELVINVKRAQLVPVDLADQPEITAFLKSIDTDEL
ncbi:MAG: hypothetical protein ACRDNF_07695, partial [Streptosporangiaceae bacterium]